MTVSEVSLGLIALAVLVMAALQVAAVVFAARAMRRFGEVLSRLEQDVRPIIANLHAISADARPIVASLQAASADAARASAVAAAQVERAERLITDVARRVDETATRLQNAIMKPAKEGMAFFRALKGVFGAVRPPGARAAARHRRHTVEEEDALFIG